MRAWLHGVLLSDDVLNGEEAVDGLGVGGRIFAGHSLVNVPDTKPFVVHNLGNNTPERLSDEKGPCRQFVIIYVHDEGKSYVRIDKIIFRLSQLLDDAPPDAASGIITAHHLETSADFVDDQMGTIVRYARFQIVGT